MRNGCYDARVGTSSFHILISSSIWKAKWKRSDCFTLRGSFVFAVVTRTRGYARALTREGCLFLHLTGMLCQGESHVPIGCCQAPTHRTFRCLWDASTSRVVRVNTDVEAQRSSAKSGQMYDYARTRTRALHQPHVDRIFPRRVTPRQTHLPTLTSPALFS